MTTQSATQGTARPEVRSAHGRGVVVGYDGSPSATQALHWAAEEAARRGRPLTVLHAVSFHGPPASLFGAGPSLASEARELSARVAEEGVRRVRSEHLVPERLPVEADVELVDVTTALVDASHVADLVVVGNRGRGGVAGALLGSTAFSVTARAACPVVVVRGEDGRRPGPEQPVVVGVDGSPSADAAVRFAADAAASAGALLRVVAAWTMPEVVAAGIGYTPYDAELVEWIKTETREVADRAYAQATAAHPDISAEVLLVEDRAQRALTAASEGAGLVVVGARGRGAVSGLFLGSVSHGVIHGASCPVAVVRAADDASAEERRSR